MLHEEIGTYEVCKLAKEKGFPQHITEEAYVVDNYGEDDYNIGDIVPIPLMPDYMDDAAAPTQSLLQRWLREEKRIDIAIVPSISMGYSYIVYDILDRDNRVVRTKVGYKTYELALEDALKFALEYLV